MTPTWLLILTCASVGLTACSSAGSDATPPPPSSAVPDSTAPDSTAPDSTAPDETPWQVVGISGANGVVTTGTDLGWDVIVGGTWSATDDDLNALEQLLPTALSEQGFDGIADRLDEYTRWYSAVEVGGERLLLVWLSCTAEADDFRDRIPFVDDGGDCYFSVTYDPADMSVRRLSVNGEA